ncbi:hypothetical protein OG474_11410 [Kribbella sp. NBC_01505]|uniref:hypothetical protein n=1 Tax=Kribbella sp. NBC_01505 TaxID=2903580 RepID=UPI003868AB00
MKRLLEGLAWPGTYWLLSLFAVGTVEAVGTPPVVTEGSKPLKVSTYWLEDPDRDLGEREVYEHDLRYDVAPADVDVVVEAWLGAAITQGAEVAWFGFEGSFHFDNLLTRDIASSIYGVADRTGVYTALHRTYRVSAEWATRVEACRGRLIC